MLHRRIFKPAKCKTSLKLATSRMKLMKNKRGVQMNQMKRELAQLLESGQDRTARIRVEHLIREEKMVAAYDLIEIYCELIAARLPIIESQKNCPIDLKEAITSVIFASPRCADIPELLDVKKHFTAKYGKEFITAALELRPDCGVGRMLVEKLSAVAPDGQSKVKVLNAIAEEHNIKWDSQLLEEKDSKPADDLLNGPSTFEKASEMHAEIPTIQVPNIQATSSHDKHVRPLNFNETNSRSSLDTQNLSSTDPGGIKTTTATHPDLRSSGRGVERMEVRHSFSEDDTFSSGRQNWYMEFKDATSAAQAAAESAERASMAARAAAELSSRGNISRQYSTESQKSTHSIRHERPADYAAVNNSFHDRNSKLQNEQIGGDAQHNLSGAGKRFHGDVHGNTERSKHSDSLRSSKGSIDDDAFVTRVQKPHGYSEKSSFKETIKAEKETLSSKIDMKKKDVESGGENVSRWKDDFSSEKFDQFGEERTGKQYSMSSSRSNSSTDIDDDDSHRVDTGPKYDEGESTSYMPSLGRNSPIFPSTTTDTWSPRRDTLKSPKKSVSQPHFSAESHSSPLFSGSLEKYVDPTESDDVPVTTYDSDGPKFDREDESEKSMYSGTNDSSNFSHKQNVFSQGPEPTHGENYGLAGSLFVKRTSGSGRRPRSESESSSDGSDSDSKEVLLKNKSVTLINTESSKKFDSRESLGSHPSPRSGKSQMELNDTGSKSYLFIPEDELNIRQSSRLSMVHIDEDNVPTTGSPDKMKDDELFNQYSSESANKLNFGTLTGGFRHKGHRHPPYNRNPSGDTSSLPNKAAEESSSRTSFYSSLRNNAEKNSSFSTSITSSDSNSDSDAHNSEEEVKKTTSRSQAPYAQKSSKEVNRKSIFGPPVATYFDRDNDDSEEDIPKQAFPNRGHSGSGSSQRTKASHPSTETSSFSKVRDGTEASVSSNSSNERKPTRSPNVAESSTNRKFQTSRPDHKEQLSSIQQASSKAMPVSKISSREENFSSSAVGQPSSPSTNKGAKGSFQNLKTSTLKAEPPTREDSAKRASHVHPKLPDYDTIAAHLQSIRKDRQ